ncbi:MAG: hypothetical protein PHF29_06320 [Candidatus Riflebacteria bacterium]|jgi:hypothetical protein|nr:hypothetical protein [Candidatus Riflebacteria bacterium]
MSNEDNNEQQRNGQDPMEDIKRKLTFFVVALVILVVVKFAIGQ